MMALPGVPNGDPFSKCLLNLMKKADTCSRFMGQPFKKRLCSENVQMNLIWAKFWKYPLLSLCI